MKKILILVAALIMVFGITATAETVSGRCNDKIQYTYDTSNGVLSVFGTGDMPDYLNYDERRPPWYRYAGNVKEVYISEGIISVGNYAFDGHCAITKVELPDSLEEVGVNSFSNCDSLREIVFPDGVRKISGAAFISCNLLSSVKFPSSLLSIETSAFSNCGSLKTIELPEGLRTIMVAAFSNCSLKSIELPESLTTLYGSAFNGCSFLTTVTIPKKITKLESGVFGNCTGLKTVYIHSNVTEIATGAFSGCLTSMTILGEKGSEAERYATENYFKFEEHYDPSTIAKGKCGENAEWVFYFNSARLVITGTGTMYDFIYASESFMDVPWNDYIGEITSVTVSGGIESVGGYSFAGCKKLKEVILADTVKKIGTFAFAECTSLVTTELPDSLIVLGDGAFYQCTSLTNIIVPNKVTALSNELFLGCTILKSVTLYDTVLSFGSCVFDECERVEINGNADSAAQTYAEQNGIPFVVISDASGTEKCGDHVYWSFDDGVLNIWGSGAMYDYSYVPGANVPTPWNSFRTSIHSIDIDEGVTYIGANAFYFVSNAVSVSTPHTLTEIGDHAFYYCGKVEGVYIPPTVRAIGDSAFGYCSSLRDMTFPEGLKVIGAYVFVGCNSIKSFTVPSTVTTIKDGAFSSCRSLENVYFNTKLESIGKYVFSGITDTVTVHVPYASYGEIYAAENGLTYVSSDVGVVRGMSLVLGDAIGIKAYFDVSDIENVVFEAMIYDGDTLLQEIPCECGYDAEQDLAYSVVYFSPHDADNQKVTFKNIYRGNYYYFGADSVTDLIDDMRKLGNSSPDSEFYKAFELLDAMEEYIACADRFFSLSASADGNINTSVSVSVEAPSREGEFSGTRYLNASLILDGRTTIRHYFIISGDIPVFKLDGRTLALHSTRNGTYYVDIENISVCDFDMTYELSLSDSMTVRFGVLNYVQLALLSKDMKLRELAASLYNYWLAAENYRTISK